MRKVLFFLTIILLFIWMFFVEPNLLIVKKYVFKNADLQGIKIVFCSDFHIKPYEEKRLKKIVKKINAQNPDLILSAGDFVNGHSEKSTLPVEIIAQNLSNLRSKYGVYTVLGNHDWWQDGDKITKKLKEKNIKVLANSNELVNLNGKELYIAGVEDLQTKNPNIKKALMNVKNPVLLLSHSPDIFPEVPKSVNLTLSGHTHGGQIRIPFLGAIVVPSKFGDRYANGLIKENNKEIIITKGLGNSILPFRFNCLPEIVIIEFK